MDYGRLTKPENGTNSAGFRVHAFALSEKNLIYQGRHLQSNMRLVLFPAILCLLLGILRRSQQSLFPAEPQQAILSTEFTPLLHIPAAEFRAVRRTAFMPFNDFPDSSCRLNDSCPATVLVTGNNRTFGEGVAANMFSNFSSPLNASGYGVFGEENVTDTQKYYYLQSKCTPDFTVPISTEDGIQEAECLQGLYLWRKNYMEINEELFEGHYNGNPKGETNEILAAYDFRDSSNKKFAVDIWYNATLTNSEETYSLGTVTSALSMVWNAFLRSLQGHATRMTLDFVGEMPIPPTLERTADIASSAGLTFFAWVILQLFPVMLSALVYEKEQKLTIMMKMHGLGHAPYWVITYIYFLIICSLYMLCFVGFGSLAGLTFFTLNSYAIQCVFYFIYINLLISSAFLLAEFFSKAKTASVVGFILVFGSWLLGLLLFNRLVTDTSFSRVWICFLELFPGLSLYRGLIEFYEYSNAAVTMGAYGMRWQSLKNRDNGIREVLIIMSVEWLLFLLMTYFAEKCHSSGCGLHFFQRSQKSSSQISQNRPSSSSEAQKFGTPVQLGAQDLDSEIEKVKKLLGEPNENWPVISNKLQKTYPAQDGNLEKHAVKGLSLAVARGECFGLLGPNGAGKTSFLSMMTGLTKPSSGTAYIAGLDLRTEMNAICNSMGVCPQHDLLWDTITGREHLNFYGKLKNLTGENLSQAVDDSLINVNLLQGGHADKRSGEYSGGMKRRLSIAISLIGDPKVVYLDEPSTGLDPASRNFVWDAVSNAKQDKAIILTTHSMEEAEHLCDRIGIFVDGSFQCLGSPDELKDRYGGTYVFTMATSTQNEKDVEELVKQLSPNAKKIYHISGTQKFEIPKERVRLSDVFLAVKSAKERFTVKGWEIANTTLEDVFIKVASDALSSTIS